MGLGIIKTENNYFSFYIALSPNHAYALANFYFVLFCFPEQWTEGHIKKSEECKVVSHDFDADCTWTQPLDL